MYALLSEILTNDSLDRPSSLIKLKPLEHFHSQRILALMDDDICQHLGRNPCTDLRDAMNYIYDFGSTQPLRFAIHHQAFGLIGVISFGCPKKLPLEAVIGYWIGRPYQGQGYARDAVKWLLAILKQLNVCRVLAEVYPENKRSERLLESVGFICEDKDLYINNQRQYYLQLSTSPSMFSQRDHSAMLSNS